MDTNNAPNIALLQAATVEAQSFQAFQMMKHNDPICQLTDEELDRLTAPDALKKQKEVS
jgi:hypothetical protein